jgi:hypothetical protein
MRSRELSSEQFPWRKQGREKRRLRRERENHYFLFFIFKKNHGGKTCCCQEKLYLIIFFLVSEDLVTLEVSHVPFLCPSKNDVIFKIIIGLVIDHY